MYKFGFKLKYNLPRRNQFETENALGNIISNLTKNAKQFKFMKEIEKQGRKANTYVKTEY